MAIDDPDRRFIEMLLEVLRLARPESMAPEAGSDDPDGQEEPEIDDRRSDPAG